MAEEDSLYNPSKHVGVHPETGIPLVRAKHKWVKPKSSGPVKQEFKPLRPFFCDCKDPETGEECGGMMRTWDDMFYMQYGMCEKCYLKYNPQLKEIEEELDNKNEEV